MLSLQNEAAVVVSGAQAEKWGEIVGNDTQNMMGELLPENLQQCLAWRSLPLAYLGTGLTRPTAIMNLGKMAKARVLFAGIWWGNIHLSFLPKPMNIYYLLVGL